MKKQLSVDEVKTARPILINGIPQNIYVQSVENFTTAIPNHLRNHTIKTYETLERKKIPNGIVDGIVVKDYPINSESISSYVESSDYRNDPAQAVAKAPKRVNLGDITEVQKFAHENPVQAVGSYADILRKVANYFETQAKQKQNPQASVQPPASEVNNG